MREELLVKEAKSGLDAEESQLLPRPRRGVR